MSQYGLHTSLSYRNYLHFIRSTPTPQRDIDFFNTIPWTRRLIPANNAGNGYRTSPFFSRYGKSGTEDTFFSKTIATDDTIPHMLLLLRNDGWGDLDPDVPKDGKQRPFTAPQAPDTVLLFHLRDGLNGFAHTAHGGAMCSLLDETLGLTVEMHRQTVSEGETTIMYTAGLNVSFLAPVPTPSVLAVRAWLLRREGRKWFLRAQVVNGEGKVLMEADSIWITTRPNASL